MNPLVFLIGCIGTRLFLAYLAFYLLTKPAVYLKIYGALLLIPAIGFTLIYMNGWRKTGPETSGKPIWWNSLRPLHAFLYFAAAFCMFFENTRMHAWKILLADVIIGLVAYLIKHST
jgi:hypothetical protein